MQTEMRAEFAKVLEELGKVSRTLGVESQDGKSGTGLVGEVRRMSGDVASLLQDRNLLRGAAAAIVGLGVLLLMGVKAWITQIIGGAK